MEFSQSSCRECWPVSMQAEVRGLSAEIRIRDASPGDAERLIEIYGYYVENTAISYEYEVPEAEEFRGRIRHFQERYPYLVLEREDRIRDTLTPVRSSDAPPLTGPAR